MGNLNEHGICPIWRNYQAQYTIDNFKDLAIVNYSPRAGGKYIIDNYAVNEIYEGNVDDSTKARLTTILIDKRQKGEEYPKVTTKLIKKAANTLPVSVSERAERLLKFIASQIQSVGDPICLNWEKASTNIYDSGAMAWSESTKLSENIYFLSYLKDRGLVSDIGQNNYRITVHGYNYISELIKNVDSSQAFVAMWFHDSMNEAYEKGFEAAVEVAGFKPLRIDRKDFLNKIEDEIIAEIRRSRFLIADFTQGEDGARGGVYFEAGFAKGLGIDVIFTCRKDLDDKLHFDTSHYNHIMWETPEDLYKKLKNRILANIGEGPNII